MMNLPDELVNLNLTIAHSLDKLPEAVTFVVALKLACLASFSVCAFALIESNLDLHASECPPDKASHDLHLG